MASKSDVLALIAGLTDARPTPQVQVNWASDSMASSAVTKRSGQAVIVMGERLLDDSRQAFFFAAHECGHIVLRHATFGRRLKNIVELLAVMGAAMAILLLAVPVGVATPPCIALIELLVLHLFLRLRVRPAEYAADDYAAEHGHSIIGVPEPEPWHWWHEILPTHPSWSRRQQRAAQRRADVLT